MMAAGAQQIERGIHRGLVNTMSMSTQKARPRSISMTLDCRKISRKKIMVKSMNFRENLAILRALSTVNHQGAYLF